MRVFLTGTTGFAGSHLADRLLANGDQVFGLVHKESGHQPIPDHEAFSPVFGDLLDQDDLQNQIEAVGPDVIFHLAGQASPSQSWNNPTLTFSVNVGGTLNLLESARRIGQPRVVIVTSALIYGTLDSVELPITEDDQPDPTHPYGISKWAASQLGRLYWIRYQLPVIEARPFNHIGPKQAPGFVVPDFSKQIAAIKLGRIEPRISVGNLAGLRDFTDVRDVVRAYDYLAKSGQPGEAYLVCSGKAVSIQTILDIILKLAEIDVNIEVDIDRFTPLETPLIYGSFEKLKRDTGWEPSISLNQSLSETLAEWLQYWANE